MRWLRRLFRRFKKPHHNPNDIVKERWETDFSRLKTRKKSRRLIPADAPDYSASFGEECFELRLKKRNLFAWAESAYYRYRDFVLEGNVSFDGENGYSAAGFLFRYASETTYYYFLVSNRGYFRFDVVFNGNPRGLIPWTPCPCITETGNSIRIIARDTRFVFCLDDTWVAEIEDDTVDAGRVCFAAQNYDEIEEARFFLGELVIDSLPLHVEAQYVRWKELLPVDPERRIDLARSLFGTGQFSAALVQLRRAAAERKLDRDEIVLLTESLIAAGLYEEALEAAEAGLEEDRGDPAFTRMKADLLYTFGRLEELKVFLEGSGTASTDSVLTNLLGNVYYGLGRLEDAAEAYEKAADLDPETPVYRVNAGRTRERLGEFEASFEDYLGASRLLFRSGSYDDVSLLLPVLRDLDAEDSRYRALEGKMFFQEEKYDEASRIFEALIAEGYDESGVIYLQALIETRKGNDPEARRLLERALRLEEGYYLFWFKYAELLFRLGEDPEEPLRRAAELAPEDPWIMNLEGMMYLARGEEDRAVSLFEKALGIEEEAVPILLNYSEALFLRGDTGRALEVLPDSNNPEIQNHRGNLLTRLGRYEEAVECYERGRKQDPENVDLLLNSAAAYTKLDLFSRADEMLSTALELDPSAEVYNLIGNLAWMKGEHQRAESAYREGLGKENAARELVLNLAELLLTRGRHAEAEELLLEHTAAAETERGKRLRSTLREKTQIMFACSSCGREWWAPRDIPDMGSFTLVGDPPRESPAGECPECGRVYCIGCAVEGLDEGRFHCLNCKTPLKLRNEYLKYLVTRFAEDRDVGIS
ncbi:MAG: tetratricopeptide repeat protein [Spirochaetia bacterium]